MLHDILIQAGKSFIESKGGWTASLLPALAEWAIQVYRWSVYVPPKKGNPMKFPLPKKNAGVHAAICAAIVYTFFVVSTLHGRLEGAQGDLARSRGDIKSRDEQIMRLKKRPEPGNAVTQRVLNLANQMDYFMEKEQSEDAGGAFLKRFRRDMEKVLSDVQRRGIDTTEAREMCSEMASRSHVQGCILRFYAISRIIR